MLYRTNIFDIQFSKKAVQGNVLNITYAIFANLSQFITMAKQWAKFDGMFVLILPLKDSYDVMTCLDFVWLEQNYIYWYCDHMMAIWRLDV